MEKVTATVIIWLVQPFILSSVASYVSAGWLVVLVMFCLFFAAVTSITIWNGGVPTVEVEFDRDTDKGGAP